MPFVGGNIFVECFKEPNKFHELGEFVYRHDLYFDVAFIEVWIGFSLTKAGTGAPPLHSGGTRFFSKSPPTPLLKGDLGGSKSELRFMKDEPVSQIFKSFIYALDKT